MPNGLWQIPEVAPDISHVVHMHELYVVFHHKVEVFLIMHMLS